MKSKSKNDVIECKKQCNKVVKLNKRCKQEFFDKLGIKNKSKSFWSICIPYKHAKVDADILLIENNTILLNNRKVVSVFNNYFKSITKNLDLFEWLDELKLKIF